MVQIMAAAPACNTSDADADDHHLYIPDADQWI